MTDNIPRQPAGSPQGGQFAATGHAEADIDLGGHWHGESERTRTLRARQAEKEAGSAAERDYNQMLGAYHSLDARERAYHLHDTLTELRARCPEVSTVCFDITDEGNDPAFVHDGYALDKDGNELDVEPIEAWSGEIRDYDPDDTDPGTTIETGSMTVGVDRTLDWAKEPTPPEFHDSRVQQFQAVMDKRAEARVLKSAPAFRELLDEHPDVCAVNHELSEAADAQNSWGSYIKGRTFNCLDNRGKVVAKVKSPIWFGSSFDIKEDLGDAAEVTSYRGRTVLRVDPRKVVERADALGPRDEHEW